MGTSIIIAFEVSVGDGMTGRAPTPDWRSFSITMARICLRVEMSAGRLNRRH